MPEIDFKSAIETNWIKLGTMEMEATGNMLGVVQDDFRFGTECLVCGAKDIRMISQTEQRSVVACDDCGGSGKRKSLNPLLNLPSGSEIGIEEFIEKKCSTCDGRGWNVCKACNGTGAEPGLIAHPQDRERRPTTGTIVSVGWRIDSKNWLVRLRHWFTGYNGYKRGDSVIYPSFAGHFFELSAEDLEGNIVDVTFGLLREEEVIARVKGHLELRRVKKSAALHTAA